MRMELRGPVPPGHPFAPFHLIYRKILGNCVSELGEESVSEPRHTLWGLETIVGVRVESPFWGIAPKRGASF